MEMDDVELIGALQHVFKHNEMMRELVDAAFVETQRTRTCGHKARVCHRVSTREQSYLVAHLD
jgi:hypothetical protein